VIDQMRAHVSDGADAPVYPAAPVKRVIDGVVFDLRTHAKEKIPIKLIGNREIASHGGGEACVDAIAIPAKGVRRSFERLRTRHTLGPKAQRAVGPDMHFATITDGAGLDLLEGGAPVVGRMPLVAHLRGDLGFLSAQRS